MSVPVVVHVLHRFDYGGLENGVVNVVNALHDNDQVHVIVALTEATRFKERLKPGVEVHELLKRPGRDWPAYGRLYKLLRKLRPAVVHTRNVGTMDCALVAFLAGVPVRIHGEHGWDVADPDGKVAKYRWFRRIFNPFVHQFVTVSRHLADWLEVTVGIRKSKIQHICNGVDITKFSGQEKAVPLDAPSWLGDADCLVVGSVCRFSPIKDPLNLVRAFVAAAGNGAPDADRLRLVMAGDGPLHKTALDELTVAGLTDRCWLPGSRDDVPAILGAMDVFVLGSLREGISNTILEAMASGLPVIATRTGGNPELVDPQRNGALVPPNDSKALERALVAYLSDFSRRDRHASESRAMAATQFSLETMINNYRELYARFLVAN